MEPEIDQHGGEDDVSPGEVVEQLGEQIRGAIESLVIALDGVDRASNSRLHASAIPGSTLYDAALTVMMRLVVLLYAEESRRSRRHILPGDREPSVIELASELERQHREDAASMDQRFDAWPILLSLFRRVVRSSMGSGGLPRAPSSRLFDPDRFPFLEGRGSASPPASTTSPRVLSNSVVQKALRSLMVVKPLRSAAAHRVRYREADIEQIGHIYEGLIDYSAERARELLVVLRGNEAILPLSLFEGLSDEALVAALAGHSGLTATEVRRHLAGSKPVAKREPRKRARVRASPIPAAAPAGTARGESPPELTRIQGMLAGGGPRREGVIRPPELYITRNGGRRRTGSYYTPRWITETIAVRALQPLVYERDDAKEPLAPRLPSRILSVRICDPAMGSGAFLVQACRYMAEALLASWEAQRARHQAPIAYPLGGPSTGEPGEVLVPESRDVATILARRAIAERCLYGVDLNPIAADLARLSLWLVAFGEDAPFPSLERHLLAGNSLLGANIDDLSAAPATFPSDAFRRDTAPPEQQGSLRALRRRCKAEAASLRAGSPSARPTENPAVMSGLVDLREGALYRALDAWTALWLWPAETPGSASVPPPTPSTFGDYLTAAMRDDGTHPQAAMGLAIARRELFLHWELAFPDAFQTEVGGFDAILGNPPWVAYAGRASQPLAPELHNFYLRRSPAFHGYRTLQGVFVHRAASLLREGGRLGLVLPTSISDLEGYAPVRQAHDALADADPDLPDFGSDAFEGVFQPSMGLLSTRRARGTQPVRHGREGKAGAWQLARTDIDTIALDLLERLSALPPLPASLFGERGFQTSSDVTTRILALSEPCPPHTCPLREGADIQAFRVRPPRLFLDPTALQARLRPDADWKEIGLLIRQTARYPIAARADGLPFRNSILAGFASDAWSAPFLLCYLNSSAIRWFHYMRNRDARQGMPQVKIAHLRALPAPVRLPDHIRAALHAIGERLAAQNQGLPEAEGQRIDELVAEALGLRDAEVRLIEVWRRKPI